MSRAGYAFIEVDHPDHDHINDLMETAIANHHRELEPARIGLAWMLDENPDADGRLVLGKMKKCTELEFRIHGLDAIILLNRDAWLEMTAEQHEALIDHELCHLQPSCDASGDQKQDDTGRRMWRIRKHDLEEFRAIVHRHGCYKDDIRTFVETAMRKQGDLFQGPKSIKAA